MIIMKERNTYSYLEEKGGDEREEEKKLKGEESRRKKKKKSKKKIAKYEYKKNYLDIDI